MQEPRTPATDRSEAGSAYVIALLVLVVLTVMGLGLALITQTEMEIGANEKTMQRLFYSADSGIQRSISAAVNNFDCAPVSGAEFNLADVEYNAGTGEFDQQPFAQQVSTSPVLPFMTPYCDLCSMNNGGANQSYSGKQTYYHVQHGVSAEAVRLFAGREYGRRTLGTVIAVQPWPQIQSCLEFVGTPEASEVEM